MKKLPPSADVTSDGETGAIIRAKDWSQTPVGPMASWPQSLKTALSICLGSKQPMFVWWRTGEALTIFYNDAYIPITGTKHPEQIGADPRSPKGWAEMWPYLESLVEQVFRDGTANWSENLLLPFYRDENFLEEAYFSFSYSPVTGESGRVEGVYCATSETTKQVFSERRLKLLRNLGTGTALSNAAAVATHAAEHLRGSQNDIPFALLYLADAKGGHASLASSAVLASGTEASPELISLDSDSGSAWPLAEVYQTQRMKRVRGLRTVTPIGGLRTEAWSEPPDEAVVLPIEAPGQEQLAGFLVVGLSPRLRFDSDYESFLNLVVGHVATNITNARAVEAERKRAQELAELDQAKTAFFSNVSHEFRTPLTLMLGPTEDALASPERALRGADLETVHRNELRLLKLVNSLLDFSRIEAGRVQASYEPTDLAALTRDLASAFRSTVERAGLRLVVDCPSLPDAVWVDHEMWEKVVLNLLSNAFKFTFQGEIAVGLKWMGGQVELSVRDTGTGIPETELPHLFERFHRVEGAHGRSYEGSGIGLALVQELVKLHSGEIRVASVLGQGTTFTVSVPTGSAHLPQERLHAQKTLASTWTRAEAFVREALGWLNISAAQLGDETAHDEEREERPIDARDERTLDAQGILPEGRVLVADDNADMRDYVRRLLAGRLTVEVVPDGQAALEAARAHPPDLVLTDVMMPRLDGFGLLRELKADARTAAVPVILLSARAGEEATVEGLKAGANDYLVKPFSARELLARVEGNLQLARARNRLSEVLESMGDAFCVLDREWRFALVNAAYERMMRTPRGQLLGRNIWEVFPPATAPGSRYRAEYRRCMEHRSPVQFVEHYAPLDLWTDVRVYPTAEGIAVFIRDVSAEKRAEVAILRQAEFEQQLVGIVSHDLRNPLQAIHMGAATLLRRDDLDVRVTKSALRIQSSVERAIRLVRDLLDFTQARLGDGIPVTRGPLDVHQLVAHVAEELGHAFPERELVVGAEGDGRGAWDGDRLTQVMHNLATNALKYSPASTPVRLSSRGADAEVVLEVHNQGAPIPHEQMVELFKPLRRGHHEAERRTGSIGLGLFIVESIVRAHGGSVQVRSNAEEGTTFTVRLPRSQPEGPAAPPGLI
ncbi:ATP-binding protein [Myxococcus sp. K38C18041901]|nr:ATP-binding protein [Myxococcus guangdongensis]